MIVPEELYVKTIPSVNGGYCFLTRTREEKIAHSILYVHKEKFIKKTMAWIKEYHPLYIDCAILDENEFLRALEKAMKEG